MGNFPPSRFTRHFGTDTVDRSHELPVAVAQPIQATLNFRWIKLSLPGEICDRLRTAGRGIFLQHFRKNEAGDVSHIRSFNARLYKLRQQCSVLAEFRNGRMQSLEHQAQHVEHDRPGLLRRVIHG